eukprot:scaffold935_cov334-Prasinococcus_capsulatus_cf.AAC.2
MPARSLVRTFEAPGHCSTPPGHRTKHTSCGLLVRQKPGLATGSGLAWWHRHSLPVGHSRHAMPARCNPHPISRGDDTLVR